MNPQRSATVAAVLCGAGAVAWFAGFASAGIDNTPAPARDQTAPFLTAAFEPEQASPQPSLHDGGIGNVGGAATVEQARGMEGSQTAASDEAKSIVDAALTEPSQRAPSAEISPAQLATTNAPDLVLQDAKESVSSVEILDECPVVDICIDRYLWALYRRTPKEDTVKVQEQRKVTVRRRGKTVTVMKSFARPVAEDFAWKDPKAAEKAGMPLMNYVIGGMDEGFKLKLFHMLQAAEQANLSPGITSAFRDDYRQSIASGLKAATDRSYHGGSFRGGYSHGLAADVVSVNGETRSQRLISTEKLWKWIDAHEKEFGIGRPYLNRDPPHVAPVDGTEYASHRGTKALHAASDGDQRKRARHAEDVEKRSRTASRHRTVGT